MNVQLPSKHSIVAIVGRPNVGKSALFNRLAGRRIAIVDKEAGITRDRIYAPVVWCGKPFQVVDTGGLVFDEKDDLKRQVEKQARMAMGEAAVIVFVVDGREGVTPLDLRIAEMLRPAGKKVVLAVNKVDTGEVLYDEREVGRLGFKPALPVSSLHGRGIGELLDAVTEPLAKEEVAEAAKAIRVAVVGKPNVGKSSYVNAILHEERAIVSSAPGTTRDSLDTDFIYRGRLLTLVDTAGIRRKRSIAKAVDYFSVVRAREAIRRADVAVVMLDGTSGITAGDLKIAMEVHEAGKAAIVFVNKWDLLEETSQRDFEADMKDRLGILNYCPVLFASAKTGKNIAKSLVLVEQVYEQSQLEINTHVLNELLHRVQNETPPPVVGLKPLKIFYATQVGTAPAQFLIFVNDPQKMKPSYRQFLIHQIRKRFGFTGVPIILRCQARR